MTGCGLHCRQALLPRGCKTAPTINFQTLHQCQCVTLTAQSGKVTHAALSTCTRQLNCASSLLDSDTAFSGHLTNKENMNRYQRGIRTIRGMTRASGRLLREHNRSPTTPQRLPPRRSGIVRSPDKKTGAIGLCAGESGISVGFLGNEFAAFMKRRMYGNTGAGNEAAGAAGRR